MAAFPSYSTGTVAVTNGGTVVTGSGGANWSGSNVKAGDDLVIGANRVIIVDVTDATHLLIDAYTGTTVSGAAYKIYKTSPLRFAGGDAMSDVSTLVAALNTDGFYVFVGPTEIVPDPSYGDENQFAFQPTTSKLWLKTGGIWVLQGIYKGFNVTGAWSSVTAYKSGDVVSLAGSSYVALAANTNQTPPNVTYWQVLASIGNTGSTGAPGSSIGINLNYSSTITDADPGAGIFRLNNATPASATAAYIDNVQVGGATISSILDLWDDSTATIKGVLRIQKSTDPTVWGQWNVTGSVVDGTGYRKLTLANGAASGTFTNSDSFVLEFYRTGNNAVDGLSYGGTSTASLAIGTGSKAFTGVGTNRAYQVGDYVRAKSAANANNYMEGTVTTYTGGVLTVNVTATGGSGTFADWNISISGSPSTIPNGAVVDSVSALSTTFTSVTTQIPVDDTIPQIGEGTQIITATITPKSTTNKLRIRFFTHYTLAVTDNVVFAMFLNSNASAIAARQRGTNAAFSSDVGYEYEFVPGVTTACTISVRTGTGNSGNTVYIHGNVSRLLGGSSPMTLVIEEIKA